METKKHLITMILALIAMCMGTQVMAQTQKIRAERDWTGGFVDSYYPGWSNIAEGQEGSITSDPNGIAINVGSNTGHYWDLQVGILDGIKLEENANYKVVVTAKFPCNGKLEVNMGSWSSNDQYAIDVVSTGDFQEVEVSFPNYPFNCIDSDGNGDAHVLLNCGGFLGTIIVKKVELWESKTIPEGTEAYAVYDPVNNSLVFNYDTRRSAYEAPTLTYGMNRDENEPAWLENQSSITGVVFDPSFFWYSPKTTCSWFQNMTALTSIGGLENLDTRKVEYMTAMFFGCSALTNLDLSSINTSNVINMWGMFLACENLETLILGSNFKTHNVMSMCYMFAGCKKLTDLNLRNFDTGNVLNMDYMFQKCSGLESLDLSSFNTSKVEGMDGMFSECYGLKSLDLSSFDTGNITSMNRLFSNCTNLETLTFGSDFNTFSVTDMIDMFYACSSLKSVDLSFFDTSNVTKMSSMFADCSSLENLDLTSFDTGKVTDMSFMFASCSNLETIVVGEKWSTGNVVESINMFYGCTSLKGGIGTNYSFAHMNDEYAHIDSEGTPGYFSSVEQISREAYAVYTEGGSGEQNLKTLTFYYDHNKSSHGANAYDLNSSDGGGLMIAKMDLSGGFQYWYQFGDGQQGSVSSDPDGVAITVGSLTGELWQPQVMVIPDEIQLKKDGNYKVVVTAKFPCSGTLQINFGSWMNNVQLTADVVSTGDFQEVEVEFLNYDYDCNVGLGGGKAHVLFMCGDFLGTTVLKKVEVWDLDAPSWKAHPIQKVVFDPSFVSVRPKSINDWFSGLSTLTTIDGLTYLDTKKVTDMSNLFSGCSSLSSIDMRNFDTSNVTKMGSMFSGCSSLTGLALGSFDTDKVTDMTSMFSGCNNLKNLSISGFITSNVTSMNNMFYGCSSLESLDLTNFNTGHVTDMENMFYDCSSLESLDLTTFDTSNVTSMSSMFRGCSGLKNLNIDGFETSKVEYMGRMFYGCSSLESLDLTNFDTSNVIDMGYMFYDCSSLESLDLSSFNTSNVNNMTWMFYKCSELVNLNLSSFNTSNARDMDSMFNLCSSLKSLDLSSFNTSNVTRMNNMFYSCRELVTITVGDKWNTDQVFSSQDMFYNCNNLVGGAGTACALYEVYDKTYARIDGGPNSATPGYLTATPPQGISTDVVNGLRDSVKGQRDGWYTIDGRKLNGKPTKKGVYIHNGKAVVN